MISKWIRLLCVIGCVQLGLVSCANMNKDKDDDRLKSRSGMKSSLLKRIKKDTSHEDFTSPIKDDVVRLEEFPDDKGEEFRIMNRQRKSMEEFFEAKPFYEDFVKKADLNQQVSMEGIDLDNIELSALIPAFASKELLNFNFVLEDGGILKGKKVNAKINNVPMSKRELWEMFERVLLLAGAYCTYDKGVVYIRPLAKMTKDNRLFLDDAWKSNVEVRIFHVRNSKSQNVAGLLKDFLTDGAKAINLPDRNDILVVESPENIEKIGALIKLLDVNERAGWPRAVMHCENVSATEIKKELIGILPILGYPVTADKATAEAGAVHLTSIDRLRVIIASAANYEALEELRRWINILDRDDIGEQERAYIYNVVNNTADDLLKAISAIFKVQSTSLAAPTKTAAKADSSGKLETKGSKVAQATKKATKTKKGERVISVFETPMKIFADGVHNRLIVRTTPRTYAMLKALLKRLDTIPSQVLLQVMIAEIRLSDNTEYGFEYSGQARTQIKDTKYTEKYGVDTKSLVTNQDTGNFVSRKGFNYYIFKDNDPSKYAYVRAFAGRGKVKILSSPQIMALSHTKAQVKVGERVPIATSEVSSASTTSELKQEIQYQDTGVLLNLTPHITKGGRIAIDLDQTVSNAIKTTSSNINSPTIQERKFITTLSLRDRSTIMVGGLIAEEKKEDKESVPVVVDLPIVSNLLGANTIQIVRTELLVLITATIIDEATSLEKQVMRYKNAIKSIEDLEMRAER